jgi:hypothetical protein
MSEKLPNDMVVQQSMIRSLLAFGRIASYRYVFAHQEYHVFTSKYTFIEYAAVQPENNSLPTQTPGIAPVKSTNLVKKHEGGRWNFSGRHSKKGRLFP